VQQQFCKRQIIREERSLNIHITVLLQGSVSIYLYIQLPLSCSWKKQQKNLKNKNQNCFSSVMPTYQHNNASRDDVKPWSLLLESLGDSSSPLAPKLHPCSLNGHTLDRTHHKVYVVLMWLRTQHKYCVILLLVWLTLNGHNAIRLYRKGQAQVDMVVSRLKHIVHPPASWQDWQPTLHVLGPSDNKVKN